MPTIEVKKGGFAWHLDRGEHPEMVRATIGNSLAAAMNCLALREKYERLTKQAYQDALTALEQVFPTPIAGRILQGVINGQEFSLKAMGTYLGKEGHGRKIFYAFSSGEPALIQHIAHGLNKTLKNLSSHEALLFIEKYLAWLGGELDLNYNTELAVSYPNKKVKLPVSVSKEGDRIRLQISAYKHYKNTTSPANVCYWLVRAKVGLDAVEPHYGRPLGGEFQNAITALARQRDEDLGNLIITAQKFDQLPGIGLGAELEVLNDKNISLGTPSIYQYSRLLSRLTHPPGMEPHLADELKSDQQRIFLKGVQSFSGGLSRL